MSGESLLVLADDNVNVPYQMGRHFGELVLVAVVLVVAWRLSASWRRPAPAWDADEEVIARALRVGHWRTLLAATGMTVVAVGILAYSGATWDPVRAAADSGPTDMTVSPPTAVTSYTRITDDRVTALQAQAHVQPPTQAWFYQSPLSQSATVLVVDTAQDDPELRDDLAAHSARDNVRHVLQQGGATGDHAYPEGPLGGALRCAWTRSDPAVPVCAWADGAMLGSLRIPDAPDLASAAKTTLMFREKAER